MGLHVLDLSKGLEFCFIRVCNFCHLYLLVIRIRDSSSLYINKISVSYKNSSQKAIYVTYCLVGIMPVVVERR